MKARAWGPLIGVVALYLILSFLIGFSGPVALAINLARVTLAVAVLVIYLPALANIFEEVPPPRRDYLLAGIILTWLSAIGFASYNELGRIYDIDTSIFVNPIGGFFSLLLVLGGVFHMIAPGSASPVTRGVALGIGLVIGVGIVFIAPLFR